MKKTPFFNKNDAAGKWVLVDVKGKTLGRVATRIARILQGKTKARYTPNALTGDSVVVINAGHIRVSGNKMKEKVYDKYSGYPSGRKVLTMEKMLEKNPAKVMYLAIKGMVPKTKLGRAMMRRLKVYPGEEHRHAAQNPQKIEV